ncbi:hypothetical protein ZWY2020_014911 [Hordeum vulgare]|nr:hypothetical protein ZWY2020_014911 [Hordeum vulgare]
MQMDVRDMSKFSHESFDCAPVLLAQFDDTSLLSGEQIHPPTPCTVPQSVHAHRPLFFLHARADYNLLEETSLVRESAHSLLGDFGGNFGRNFEGCPGAKLSSSLVALRKPAERRSVRLFFLPRGLTRRAQNRSRHDNMSPLLTLLPS